ncbi:hypothetical protein V6Z11_D09G280100 [Gossypium hirsutum]
MFTIQARTSYPDIKTTQTHSQTSQPNTLKIKYKNKTKSVAQAKKWITNQHAKRRTQRLRHSQSTQLTVHFQIGSYCLQSFHRTYKRDKSPKSRQNTSHKLSRAQDKTPTQEPIKRNRNSVFCEAKNKRKSKILR